MPPAVPFIGADKPSAPHRRAALTRHRNLPLSFAMHRSISLPCQPPILLPSRAPKTSRNGTREAPFFAGAHSRAPARSRRRSDLASGSDLSSTTLRADGTTRCMRAQLVFSRLCLVSAERVVSAPRSRRRRVGMCGNDRVSNTVHAVQLHPLYNPLRLSYPVSGRAVDRLAFFMGPAAPVALLEQFGKRRRRFG